MDKQRNVLKGRVKKLLKSQKDMGQISESALLCCVSSLEVFVRDLGKKIKAQAAASGGSCGDEQTITPIELKRAVEGSSELGFLRDKVAEIDESAVKYHKIQARKGKRAAAGSAAGESKRPAKETARKKAVTVDTKPGAGAEQHVHPVKPITSAPIEPSPAGTQASMSAESSLEGASIAIDEDDAYDESESESD